MTTTKTFVADDDGPDLDTLQNLARRHRESMDGLRATETFYNQHIAELDVTVTTLTKAVDNLPDAADANTVHDAKKALIQAELAHGLASEERGRLLLEINETAKLAADNAKAVAKAKAALP